MFERVGVVIVHMSSGAAFTRSKTHMKVFRLFVKTEQGWEMVCAVEATDRNAALKEATLLLKQEHRGKPMEIREDAESASDQAADD